MRAASWIAQALPEDGSSRRVTSPLVRRLAGGETGGEVTARMRSGASFVLDLADPRQGRAFLSRAPEEPLLRFVDDRLGEGGTLLHVGAGEGFLAIQAAVRGRERGVRVHAFEPQPDRAERLRRNLVLNESASVVFHEAALGSDAPASTLDAYRAHEGLGRVEIVVVDVGRETPAVLAGARETLGSGGTQYVVCSVAGDAPGDSAADMLAEYGYRPVGDLSKGSGDAPRQAFVLARRPTSPPVPRSEPPSPTPAPEPPAPAPPAPRGRPPAPERPTAQPVAPPPAAPEPSAPDPPAPELPAPEAPARAATQVEAAPPRATTARERWLPAAVARARREEPRPPAAATATPEPAPGEEPGLGPPLQPAADARREPGAGASRWVPNPGGESASSAAPGEEPPAPAERRPETTPDRDVDPSRWTPSKWR